MKPLWSCPACARSFANRDQSHACGRQGLEGHFEGKPAEIRRLFDAFVARLEEIGPFEICRRKLGSPSTSACRSSS